MTRRSNHLLKLAVAAGVLPLLVAADRPQMLQRTEGGLWEVQVTGETKRQRVCVADTAVLAQFEHRGKACTRVVIRDTAALTEIHYTCAGGGFGRTTMTLITPRSLRLETQGISNQAPFYYVFQARRVGGCRN